MMHLLGCTAGKWGSRTGTGCLSIRAESSQSARLLFPGLRGFSSCFQMLHLPPLPEFCTWWQGFKSTSGSTHWKHTSLPEKMPFPPCSQASDSPGVGRSSTFCHLSVEAGTLVPMGSSLLSGREFRVPGHPAGPFTRSWLPGTCFFLTQHPDLVNCLSFFLQPAPHWLLCAPRPTRFFFFFFKF